MSFDSFEPHCFKKPSSVVGELKLSVSLRYKLEFSSTHLWLRTNHQDQHKCMKILLRQGSVFLFVYRNEISRLFFDPLLLRTLIAILFFSANEFKYGNNRIWSKREPMRTGLTICYFITISKSSSITIVNPLLKEKIDNLTRSFKKCL